MPIPQPIEKANLACQLQDIFHDAVGAADTSHSDIEIANLAEVFVVFQTIQASVGEAIREMHELFRGAKAVKGWHKAKDVMAEAIEKSPRTIERLEQNAREAAATYRLETKLLIFHGFDPGSQEAKKLRQEIHPGRNGEAVRVQSRDDPITERIRKEIMEDNQDR